MATRSGLKTWVSGYTAAEIAATPRVGVAYAMEDALFTLAFFCERQQICQQAQQSIGLKRDIFSLNRLPLAKRQADNRITKQKGENV